MFHPLISPFSTYIYSTEAQDDGAVSATNFERLPPGGFSLRHGFPDWFGRSSSTGGDSKSSGQQNTTQTPPRRPTNASLSSGGTSSANRYALGESTGFAETNRNEISTFGVLRYIRRTFNDEDVLDSIPLAAAANPGAWSAWRTHRMENGKVFSDAPRGSSGNTSNGDTDNSETTETTENTGEMATAGTKTVAEVAIRPGEWNWEGVWEQRVKKAITASLSEPVLFGSIGTTDDVVSLPGSKSSESKSISIVTSYLLSPTSPTSYLSYLLPLLPPTSPTSYLPPTYLLPLLPPTYLLPTSRILGLLG